MNEGRNMGVKEIPLKGGEQMTFTAIELGEVVREMWDIEVTKKEANSEWNDQLKQLKKRSIKLADAMRQKDSDSQG